METENHYEIHDELGLNPILDSFDSQINFNYWDYHENLISNENSDDFRSNVFSQNVIIEIYNSLKKAFTFTLNNNDNIQNHSVINPYTTETIQNVNNIKKNKVIKEEENKKDKQFPFKVDKARQLRGRKRTRSLDGHRPHDRYQLDNIKRKLQTKFFNFIIFFINKALEKIDSNEKFYPISYDFKCSINSETFQNFKKFVLGDIVRLPISNKFKKIEKGANSTTYDKVKNLPLIKNILKENFFAFFKDAFYSEERLISLKKYGSNLKIRIPDNVEMYIDLKKENKYDYYYIKSLEECVEKNFFTN